MKVSGRMVADSAMEYASGQTEIDTSGNGKMTKGTEKDSILSQMATYMKVTG